MRIRARVEGIGRFKAAISEIKKEIVSPAVIDRLSNGLKERLVERAAIGIDAAGGAFKPYTARSAKSRARRGEGVDVVTLRDTGAMLDSMTVDEQPTAGVSFGTSKEAEKARYLQETGAGKAQTKRRFFAVSDADMAWALDTLSGHAKDTIRAAFVKGG